MKLLKEQNEEYFGHGGYEGDLVEENDDILTTNCSHCGSAFQVSFRINEMHDDGRITVEFINEHREYLLKEGKNLREMADQGLISSSWAEPDLRTYDSLRRLKDSVEEMMMEA